MAVMAVEPHRASGYASAGFAILGSVRELSSDMPFAAVLLTKDLLADPALECLSENLLPGAAA
jgi:hypothetical protein